MSKKLETFVDLALLGRVLLMEIDDFVDAWHENDHDVSLHEYIGFTQEEYSLWVSEPDMLPYIISARRDHVQLGDMVARVVNDNHEIRDERIAARAGDVANIDRLKRWLHNAGIEFN